MGMLALKRLMSIQRDRRRRQQQSRDVFAPMLAKRGYSFRQQRGGSEGGKRLKYSEPDLPEDIWHYIYSLVPMKDAACAACVSRAFLSYWRCYPNIRFSNSVISRKGVVTQPETAREFTSKVNHVLINHSGIGLKSLNLQFIGHSSSDRYFIDSWLQVAVGRQIEELSLRLVSSDNAIYRFPCSVLSDQCGNLIRYLQLSGCIFRPAVRLSCFRGLINLHLYYMRINEDELGCLLSSCSALEKFVFVACKEIICLKIPCTLQRLSYMQVLGCGILRVIESKAPNLSSFFFSGKRVQLSLGESLLLKNLTMSYACALDDAHDMLLSTIGNLETLKIVSGLEANTPMMRSQFLCLKYLKITIDGYGYAFPHINDYMSLVPFLDASPSLETFVLIAAEPMEHESIFRDPSHLRRMSGHIHDKLKHVKIVGFNSAKSLIELVVHIIENAGSLESLTLDTTRYSIRSSNRLRRRSLVEVPRALFAIQAYLEGIVPSTVKLDVLKAANAKLLELE